MDRQPIDLKAVAPFGSRKFRLLAGATGEMGSFRNLGFGWERRAGLAGLNVAALKHCEKVSRQLDSIKSQSGGLLDFAGHQYK